MQMSWQWLESASRKQLIKLDLQTVVLQKDLIVLMQKIKQLKEKWQILKDT